MNSIKATPKFYLHIHGHDSSDIWPRTGDPKMDERIKEGYCFDEDCPSCGFEIKDSDDLMRILKIYIEKRVKFHLIFHVESPELQTVAYLGDGNPKSYGTIKHIETEKLTPQAAAGKLMAIAHALTKP